MGFHSLLQRIFSAQGSNPCFLHCKQIFFTIWAIREALFHTVKKMLIFQSCPTLCEPMDYSLPGSSVHGILLVRKLEWLAMPSTRWSSQPRDQTQVSHITGSFFIFWAFREAHSIESVQSLSCVQLFVTPWNAALQASLSITNSRSLPKLMSIESVTPLSHSILFCPFLLLPSIFPSTRVFSNESALRIRWPKYWNFSFNISPSSKHSGLISFSMDWLDLLAVQGTLKSLLQHHSSKASIIRHSAFFIVQLSHPYMTTGKTTALTKQTFVDKVMSLLFNMLSRLVITFLPRSKCHLISWLQSPSAVILEPKKIKSVTVSTISHYTLYKCLNLLNTDVYDFYLDYAKLWFLILILHFNK